VIEAPNDTPVVGDGVITFPDSPTKVKKMALDLPEGVGQLMMTESAGNIQASNRNSRNTSDVVMGALQGTVVQNFKDVGVVEGRSVSGILATPIAGPANGQKA
jgi:hypothetical protein